MKNLWKKSQKSFPTRRSYLRYIYNFFRIIIYSINIKREKGKQIKIEKISPLSMGLRRVDKDMTWYLNYQQRRGIKKIKTVGRLHPREHVKANCSWGESGCPKSRATCCPGARARFSIAPTQPPVPRGLCAIHHRMTYCAASRPLLS